jgi:glycerol-3-phosphate cytidylyltransferase-like family protein
MMFLKECAQFGWVIVGLSTDPNASRKRAPVMSYLEREAALSLLPWVDVVVPKSEASAEPIIYDVRPDMLVYGSDWTEEEWMAENLLDINWLVDQRIGIRKLHNPGFMSTTEIIERVFRSRG